MPFNLFVIAAPSTIIPTVFAIAWAPAMPVTPQRSNIGTASTTFAITTRQLTRNGVFESWSA
jgi:hypothetical protein